MNVLNTFFFACRTPKSFIYLFIYFPSYEILKIVIMTNNMVNIGRGKNNTEAYDNIIGKRH